MKRFAIAGAICTAFLVAAMVPSFAQDDHPQDNKGQDAHQQDTRSQDEHQNQERQDHDRQMQQKNDQEKHDQEQHNQQTRRIDDAHFREHFGRNHHFAVHHVTMVGGRPHFAYGGYNFEIVQAWPAGWAYSDPCYIDYVDGTYFLYDLDHPGIQLELIVL